MSGTRDLTILTSTQHTLFHSQHTMAIYGRLEEGDEIRLLHIGNREQSQQQNSIKCSLETHKLSSPSLPSFSALSYTWGPSHPDPSILRSSPWTKDSRIVCNDEAFEVQPNLYDFLHEYVSRLPPGSNASYLWVDALCINQLDIAEKSHQVGLMAKIYQAATQVIVWLGSADRLGDQALELVAGIAALSVGERAQLRPRDVTSNHANKLLDLNHWEALIRFFQRSWFDRVWIIQEVVLAKTAIVWCGQKSMSFDHIGVVSDYLATSVWTNFMSDPRLAPNRTGLKTWHNSPTRLVASRRKRQRGGDDSFLHALVRARKSHCHDPKDKVYSQLGLGNAELHPSYTKPLADVYIDAAQYIMQKSGKLLVLAYVEGCQNVPGLPSWVVDWTHTDNVGLGITGYPQFHADGDQSPAYSIFQEESKHILRVRARRIDTIAQTCETKKDLRQSLVTSKLWSMIRSLDEEYNFVEGQTREEALWRSLMTDREAVAGEVQYPASKEPLESSFRAWIFWCCASRSGHSSVVLPQSSRSNVFPSPAEIEETLAKVASDPTHLQYLEHEASTFQFAFSLATHLQPFTTQGGYIGVGVEGLQEGDSVWIVPGCCVPLILRAIKDSTRYRLVGGSYVHGIMNGQAISNVLADGYGDIELE